MRASCSSTDRDSTLPAKGCNGGSTARERSREARSMHLQQEGCKQSRRPSQTHTTHSTLSRLQTTEQFHWAVYTSHPAVGAPFPSQSFLRQRSWKAPILGPYLEPLHSQNTLSPLDPHCLFLNQAILRTLPISSCNVAVFSGGNFVKAWDRDGETRYFRTECSQRGPTTGCSKEGSNTPSCREAQLRQEVNNSE